MLYRNLLALSGVLLIGSAHAFNVANGSFTTQPGFPWVGNTNYGWLLTNGVETHSGTNQGDGVFNNNAAAPLGAWFSSTIRPLVRITGTVDVSQAVSGSYLQIGLVTRNQADRAFDWYASGMFNNSAVMTFNWDGAVSLTDFNGSGGHTSVGNYGTGLIDFDVTFDLSAMLMSTTMGGGKSRSFGLDNWGTPGFEDFSQYAVLINSYNEGSALSTFSWQSVAVQADPVPEPFTMGLAGAALVAALKKRRKARKA